MADLDVSIATFDERLSDIGSDGDPPSYARLTGTGDFPAIDPDARREVAAITPPTNGRDTLLPSPPQQTPLLRELAASAEASAQRVRTEAKKRRNTAFEIGGSLQRANDYLLQFVAHCNDLLPPAPIGYAVDLDHPFADVRWHEGSVRTATRSQSERSLIEKLTLRIRYASAALSFVAADAALKRIENELYLASIDWQDAGTADIAGRIGCRRIDVAGSIPAQLVFTADVAGERILLRCRNLNALGLSAFAFPPTALDPAALDELGRCLLGQSRRLPATFRPIPFNTPDSKA
jgi:hypothetical protein